MSLLTANRTEDDPRWAQVVSRDAAADGRFYYCVTTTGVYCRPSCRSRAANPKNVRFHATAQACEAAGFRPCKRCRPNTAGPAQEAADKVVRACRSIAAAETPPSLSELAAEAGLSPHHFHRLFKSVTGLTPGVYAKQTRAARARDALAQAPSVTRALYDAGFNSSGRFYAASDAMLGMAPSSYRAGGRGAQIRFAVGECSLGSILVARSDKGICAILMGDDPEALVRDLQDRFAAAQLIGGDDAFEATVAAVVGFVEAPGRGLDLPLDLRGTAFQQRVWEALRGVPAGETISYTQLAGQIGAPKAVRAVAGACAANPVAVAIPCHRVVRSDGALSGYRWGIERKRALLDRESA